MNTKKTGKPDGGGRAKAKPPILKRRPRQPETMRFSSGLLADFTMNNENCMKVIEFFLKSGQTWHTRHTILKESKIPKRLLERYLPIVARSPYHILLVRQQVLSRHRHNVLSYSLNTKSILIRRLLSFYEALKNKAAENTPTKMATKRKVPAAETAKTPQKNEPEPELFNELNDAPLTGRSQEDDGQPRDDGQPKDDGEGEDMTGMMES